jgi:hypothetical protein
MDDTPLQNLLFKMTTAHYFTIDDFLLHLLDEHPAIDVVIYTLVKEDFSIPLFIFGIDSTHPAALIRTLISHISCGNISKCCLSENVP